MSEEKSTWYTPNPKPENLHFVAGPHKGTTGRKRLPSGSKSQELYYRGRRWLGPSNAIGHGKLALIPVSAGSSEFGYAPC